MADTTKTNDLDWDNLSTPVPMNLLDSDFADASDEMEAKTIEPEIVVQEPIKMVQLVVVTASTPVEAKPVTETVTPKLNMHVHLKAAMDAQAKADEDSKAKAEAEEAAQRERLEKWMANARARLTVADEEPPVPGAPVRVRRDPSPTIIRRSEMQRTIGDAEEAEAMLGLESSSGYKTGKISLDGSDPMATIIVPQETFVESANAQSQKLKSLERRVSQIKERETAAGAAGAGAAGAETMIMAAPLPRAMPSKSKLALWVIVGMMPIILGLAFFALVRTGYLESLADVFPSLFSHPIAKSETAPLKAPVQKPVLQKPVTEELKPATPPTTSPAISAPTISTPSVPAPVVSAPPVPVPTVSAPTVSAARPSVPPRVTPSIAPKKVVVEQRVAPIKMVVAKSVVAKPKAALPQIPKTANSKSPPVKTPLSAIERANQALANARRHSDASMAGIATTQPRKTAPTSTAASPSATPAATPSADPAPSSTSENSESATSSSIVADVHLATTTKNGASNAVVKSAVSPKSESALKASIQKALNGDKETLQSIYDRYAMGTPELVGGVVIGLTVDPSGRILDGIIAASTTGLPGFDQDLLHRVMEWKLDPFPDTQARYFSVPFHFEPKPQ